MATAFLTRMPLDVGVVDERELARALAFFPLVGLLLGLGLVGLEALLPARLPHELRAALLVGALAVATGGLHIDGVADLCDALGGGRGERGRMLEIMRDSRIGAHGAAGVTLLLVAKVAALSGVLAQPRGAALLLFPGAARCAVVPCIAWFRYARDTGLGASFQQARSQSVAGAALIFGIVAAFVDAARALPAAAVALIIALALSAWVGRRLGGLTGDVYGATIELAELAFLTAWLALG